MKNTVKKLNKLTKNSFMSYGLVLAFYILMQTLISGGNIKSSLKGQLIPICAYVIMAVSLNLTVGILGELSLGHAGFMSIGAFAGVVTSQIMGYNGVDNQIARMIVSVIVGAALAGIFGFLIGIPVLRLNGDYLAIVTLAFGEIIKDILNCIYLGIDNKGLHLSFKSDTDLHLGESGKVLLKGPMGATGVTKISTFTFGIVLVLITLVIVYNLTNSRTGRAIMAIRDNKIAAESVGINVTKYKMTAFVTSAALAGIGGVLYGLNFSTVVASKFNFNTSILVLVFVVIGGMGNIFGSVIAAAALTVLPELLREFNDYRMLIYAIVLILVMIITNNDTVGTYKELLKHKIKKKFKSDKNKNAVEQVSDESGSDKEGKDNG